MKVADEIKRNMTLTIEGQKLMAKCIAGNNLNVESIVLGDGRVPDGISSLRDMTAVVNPKMKLPVVYKRVDGAGTAILECQLKNSELTHGFFARECGVYAKDPETGDLVLYSYRNTGDFPEYVPAASSGETIDNIYTVIVVIDQIENVTVTIEEGIGSVSRAEYYGHLADTNPHPGAFQFGDKVSEAVDVFVGMGEARRFHRIGVSDFRKQILGSDSSMIPVMAGRISQLELELANIGIQTMVKEELNLSNLFIYEDFSPANLIDNTMTKVTAITAGSNTIAVESLMDITQGSWYWITDGILKEAIQVASMQNNDDLCRIITKTPIRNTYNIPTTMLYRSTAGVKDGMAVGSADRRAVTWNPSIVWTGEGANTSIVVELDSSLSKAGNFRTTGDAKFTADGFMTLDATVEHAHGSILTLVRTGGGKGTWAITDEKGASF